jgi:hypothetical protein
MRALLSIVWVLCRAFPFLPVDTFPDMIISAQSAQVEAGADLRLQDQGAAKQSFSFKIDVLQK